MRKNEEEKWRRKNIRHRRDAKFFRLMLCHLTLKDYYQIIFSLVQHHKYSISDIENLIPYERDLYFAMLINFIEKQKEESQRGR